MNGHDDTPAAGRPTATALRRALKRAANGVSLDVTDAAVPLRARGPDLTALTGPASRTGDAGLPATGRPGVIAYSRKWAARWWRRPSRASRARGTARTGR